MYALTKSELLSLLTAAKADSERNYLMILTAFSHGLRVSEVIAIRKGIEVSGGFVDVQRLKGSMRTVQSLVDVNEPLLNERSAMTGYLAQISDGERLFPISRRRADQLIKRYCIEAGIPVHKSSMHKLKHTCGMTAVKAGIEYARQRLGHKNISSTGMYLKVSDEAASLAFVAALGA